MNIEASQLMPLDSIDFDNKSRQKYDCSSASEDDEPVSKLTIYDLFAEFVNFAPTAINSQAIPISRATACRPCRTEPAASII